MQGFSAVVTTSWREDHVKGAVWTWVIQSGSFINTPNERCWRLELNSVLKPWGLMRKCRDIGTRKAAGDRTCGQMNWQINNRRWCNNNTWCGRHLKQGLEQIEMASWGWGLTSRAVKERRKEKLRGRNSDGWEQVKKAKEKGICIVCVKEAEEAEETKCWGWQWQQLRQPLQTNWWVTSLLISQQKTSSSWLNAKSKFIWWCRWKLHI